MRNFLININERMNNKTKQTSPIKQGIFRNNKKGHVQSCIYRKVGNP